MSKSLFETDANYAAHNQKADLVSAFVAGKEEVLNLVTALPKPMYATGTLSRTHFEDADAYNRAVAHATRKNSLNTEKVAAYWSRGALYPATARTHAANEGMIHQNAPVIEASDRVLEWTKSVNKSGHSFNKINREITSQLERRGRFAVWVDMPRVEGERTKAQNEDRSSQPNLITYPSSAIYSAYEVDGKLYEVRLYECYYRPKADDEFTWEEVKQIRRLVIKGGVYTVEVYEENGKLKESTTPKMNSQLMDFIPCVIYGAESNGAAYSKIPLKNLADLNRAHFVEDCNVRTNSHVHAMGMRNVYSGLSPDEFDEMNPLGLDMAADGVNMLGQGDKVEILNAPASTLTMALRAEDVQGMIQAGAQMVQNTNSNKTLGATKIEAGATTSVLGTVVRNASEGSTNILNWVAGFMGESQDCKYEINSEFITDAMTPEMLVRHYELVQGGVLPLESLWESARKANLTKDDNETIKDKLDAQEEAGGTTEEMAALQADIELLKEATAQLTGDTE